MKSRIMILRPGALGDTLMLLPALISLKESYEVFFVGMAPGLDYLKPYVAKCYNYERANWHRLFLQSDFDSPPIDLDIEAIIAFLSDPEKIAGKNLELWFPSADVHLFRPFPDESDIIHTSEYISRCIEKAGLEIDPDNCLKNAKENPLLQIHGKNRIKSKIVIHPGSGSTQKNYSPDFWVKLIKSFLNNPVFSKSRITLLMGPAEEESLAYYKENLNDNGVDILFYPDKESLLKELYSSILFMGHDSGITHLAAMLGVSVIALFKNSSVTQWRPLGPKVKIISGIIDETDLLNRLAIPDLIIPEPS